MSGENPGFTEEERSYLDDVCRREAKKIYIANGGKAYQFHGTELLIDDNLLQEVVKNANEDKGSTLGNKITIPDLFHIITLGPEMPIQRIPNKSDGRLSDLPEKKRRNERSSDDYHDNDVEEDNEEEKNVNAKKIQKMTDPAKPVVVRTQFQLSPTGVLMIMDALIKIQRAHSPILAEIGKTVEMENFIEGLQSNPHSSSIFENNVPSSSAIIQLASRCDILGREIASRFEADSEYDLDETTSQLSYGGPNFWFENFGVKGPGHHKDFGPKKKVGLNPASEDHEAAVRITEYAYKWSVETTRPANLLADGSVDPADELPAQLHIREKKELQDKEAAEQNLGKSGGGVSSKRDDRSVKEQDKDFAEQAQTQQAERNRFKQNKGLNITTPIGSTPVASGLETIIKNELAKMTSENEKENEEKRQVQAYAAFSVLLKPISRLDSVSENELLSLLSGYGIDGESEASDLLLLNNSQLKELANCFKAVPSNKVLLLITKE